LTAKNLGRDEAVSAYRHCLDQDYAIQRAGARLDVTWL
jgi:hypothetical protein